MAIIINIDVMLAKRKMSVTELADKVGITMANISVLKNGKAKAIRLSTLEAICVALECQPGDLLEYKKPSRVPVDLVESGLDVADRQKQRFHDVAERLAQSKDPAEKTRLKDG